MTFNERLHPRDSANGEFVDVPGTKGLEHVAEALARTPAAKVQAVQDFADRMETDHPGLRLSVTRSSHSNVITLHKIVAPVRSKGTGTKVMQALTELADRHGDMIALTPSSDFGGSKARLIKFYQRFGFVQNKGRNKDYEISEDMYRPAGGS